MKFFDLFCGVGGFRLGMERNGHECIGSCEIDKYARQTYAKNFSHEPEFSDVTHINTNDIEDFDVLCGGFPCQAWSIAGYRKGFEDNRGDLFFQIVRIVREKQPTYLFLENVKGLLSHDKGASFREMLRTLDEVGYDLEWQIINSKYFVPQNRERLFIIGHFRGKSRGKILPLGFNTKDNSGSQGLKYYRNSKDDSFRIHNPDGIARTLRANSGGMGSKTGVYAVVKDHGKLRELKDDKSTMIGANYFKGADNHGERTLIQKGMRVRRLTPLECERLQGFPDNWTKGLSDTQRYKQMGNAVTVNVIQYIATNFERGGSNESFL